MSRTWVGRTLDRRTMLQLGGAGALAGGAAAATAASTHAQPDQHLDGIWRCTFARTLPAPNPLLNRRTLTCSADGTALLGGPPATPDGSSVVYRDLGQGGWLRSGDRRFTLGIVLGNFSADGAPLYETVLTMQVTVAQGVDAFEGTYASQDIAPDGAVRGTRDGLVTAERIRFPA